MEVVANKEQPTHNPIPLTRVLSLSLSHIVYVHPLARPFLEEAIGDGDGVPDAAVDLLCGVAPLPHAAGAVAAVLHAGVDHGLLLLHPAADVADEAVDAAEEHRAEDEHGRHQDLHDDGRGGRREFMGALSFKVLSIVILFGMLLKLLWDKCRDNHGMINRVTFQILTY